MADRDLPDEGPLHLGSVTLPAGRLITPGYGSGEPVAWATIDPVPQAGRVWAALSHHDVTYRFVAGGREHHGSGSADRKYQIGDSIDVIYHTDRPDFNQLASGGVVTSTGLNVFVMVAMVATEIWLLSLMHA